MPDIYVTPSSQEDGYWKNTRSNCTQGSRLHLVRLTFKLFQDSGLQEKLSHLLAKVHDPTPHAREIEVVFESAQKLGALGPIVSSQSYGNDGTWPEACQYGVAAIPGCLVVSFVRRCHCQRQRDWQQHIAESACYDPKCNNKPETRSNCLPNITHKAIALDKASWHCPSIAEAQLRFPNAEVPSETAGCSFGPLRLTFLQDLPGLPR